MLKDQASITQIVFAIEAREKLTSDNRSIFISTDDHEQATFSRFAMSFSVKKFP